MGCLYVLQSPTGKRYIGISTKTFEERWNVHQMRVKEGRSQALQAAIRKYGAANITGWTLVIADNWDYLCELERRAIQTFGTLSPNGYNLTTGGEGVPGRVHTEAAARNMSAGQRRRFSDPAERQRLAEQGRWQERLPEKAAEAHRKRSEKMKTPDVRAKLSAAARKQFESEAGRARAVEIGKAAMRDPARRAKISTTVRKLMEDPTYRDAHGARMRAALAAPEVRAKMKAAAQRRAADPEWRKRMSDAKKGQRAGTTLPPEVKAKMAEARRKRWQDPEYRAKQADARERRRALSKPLD